MLRKTKDGSLTIYNKRYNELYHSDEGALLEARSLYIESSGFSSLCQKETWEHSSKVMRICDVGLGLGYNALSSLEEWLSGKGFFELEIYSLENDKELFANLGTGEASWQSSWTASWKGLSHGFKEASKDVWTKEFTHPLSGQKALWFVYLGDGRDSLEKNKNSIKKFDFIWQDPFSPKASPELWDKDWFKLLTGLSKDGTVLMTYSVARPVKKALEENFWGYEKIPTVTKKKSWLKAKLGQSRKENLS